MKKTVVILSIVSISIICISFLITVAFLTCLLEMMSEVYILPIEFLEEGPIVPIGNIVRLFGILIISFALLITYKSNKYIAIEILLIIFLVIIFPALSNKVSLIQAQMIHSIGGTMSVARLAITENILAFPTRLGGIVSSLCIVICGIRIADKINHKSKSRETV